MSQKKKGPVSVPAAKAQEPAEKSELDKLRASIDTRFQQASQLLSAVWRPLPLSTGNYTYVDEKVPSSVFADLRQLRISDIPTLIGVMDKKWTGEAWDDREYLMENIIKLVSKLPAGSKAARQVTEGLVTTLWNDLPHPPQSFIGSYNWKPPAELQDTRYRSADGSNNNIYRPEMGAAGTPYARTTRPTLTTRAALPDPGMIFDSIMSRQYEQDHENGISSMLFYIASIIIHDLFRTNHEDFRESMTSSYLDLSPLYGSNINEQRMMRTFKAGKIKPDCFSEKRILGFPPGVSAILIMFNRFHNHVVENLALINEGGRFDTPEQDKPKAEGRGYTPKTYQQYDEDLFQTGRLITCGLYINIVLIDYVRTILNLNRSDSNWQLNPRIDIKGGPPRGVGNQTAAEFNLVYRWHSTISKRDVRWTEELYRETFGGKDYNTLSMEEFLGGLKGLEAEIDKNDPNYDPKDKTSFPDPFKRDIRSFDFKPLQRGEDGKFNDDDLVRILTESIEDCANSFGAQRVPAVMKAVEVLGMKQARAWNLGTLNEFREYFGLTKYKSFEEINPDPYVAEQLKRLYDEPDFVELYPGIVIEAAKRAEVPGSGLMPPYTTSRTILSDAVALVRGDRFYTIDYTPKHLTNWGYAEAGSDTTIDNGCVFYKLFYTAFPNHFERNSIYAHYPLTIPKENKAIFDRLEKSSQYSWKKPQRKPAEKMIASWKTSIQVMNDKDTFGVTWGDAMVFLMGEEAKDFMLAGDGPPNAKSRQVVGKAMFVEDWYDDVKNYYANKSQEILDAKKYKIADVNQIDIIRDLGNTVHVHFVSDMFSLPLKTKERPLGIFTELEIYLIMAAVFTCVFFDLDPQHSFQVHQLAHGATQKLGEIVEENVRSIKHSGPFSRVIQAVFDRGEKTPLQHYGIHMIKRLLDSGMSTKQLVWGHILGTAGGMVPNQGQLFAQMIDYYFSKEGSKHWPDIAKLAHEDTDAADEKLMHYLLEGSRIYCGSAVFREVRKDVTLQDGDRKVDLKRGETVFVNLYAASHDPEGFPEPDQVRLDRPVDSYLQFGWGPHQCLGMPMTRVALTQLLKTVAKLPGLRPAPGLQGKVAKVPSDIPGYNKYLTEGWNGFFPFPCSMKVQWDD